MYMLKFIMAVVRLSESSFNCLGSIQALPFHVHTFHRLTCTHTRSHAFTSCSSIWSSPKTIDIKFSLLCYCYPSWMEHRDECLTMHSIYVFRFKICSCKRNSDRHAHTHSHTKPRKWTKSLSVFVHLSFHISLLYIFPLDLAFSICISC